RFPSGPLVIEFGPELAVVIVYSVNDPDVVTFAILFVALSQNQRFPSGPLVIPFGLLAEVGTVYSASSVPADATFGILFGPASVTQMLLSGPVVMPVGWLPDARPPNSVTPLTPFVIVAMVLYVPFGEVARSIR